ncbi:hypothetical protein BLOT_008440 [Blomia tropicalis]|nr:hypothetical protein BLOT_008440 [Blomia tropicalis]
MEFNHLARTPGYNADTTREDGEDAMECSGNSRAMGSQLTKWKATCGPMARDKHKQPGLESGSFCKLCNRMERKARCGCFLK